MWNGDKKYAHYYCGFGCLAAFLASFYIVSLTIPSISSLFRTLAFLSGAIFSCGIIYYKKNPKILLGASAFGLISSIIQCVEVIANTPETSKTVFIWNLLFTIAIIVVFGLGILAYFKKEHTDRLIKYAYCVSLLSTGLLLRAVFGSDGSDGIASLVMMIITIVVYFACFQFAKKAVKQAQKQEGVSAKASSNKIEKIAQLKKLLDAGAITQEEFEEKKNQLLEDKT